MHNPLDKLEFLQKRKEEAERIIEALDVNKLSGRAIYFFDKRSTIETINTSFCFELLTKDFEEIIKKLEQKVVEIHEEAEQLTKKLKKK